MASAAPAPPIRFRFREGRSNVYGRIQRPSASVELRTARGTWLTHPMYVDSGADFSLVPKEVGEMLGFVKDARDTPRQAGGIGGWIWVIMRRAQMRLGEHAFVADVGWAQTDHAPLLLGRADVFDRFDVVIRQRDRVTEFRWRGR